MKKTLFILLSLFFINCGSQKEKKFNLDFESYSHRYLFPTDWMEWGDYSLQADTIIVHSGKFSGKIKSKKEVGSFGSIAYKIPANYKGKSIQLEGYMKIKNVENGFGGLLLRIDGNQTSLGFDNMESQNINGTKDWQKYSINLPYPEEAETIYVAGILTRTGEAWFDDYWMNYRKITIPDGKGGTKKIASLVDFVKYRHGELSLIVPKRHRDLKEEE